MTWYNVSVIAVLLGLMAITCGCITCGNSVTAPEQPDGGPGGSEYQYASVKTSTYGQGGTQYWLFEPVEPEADKLPLIVFGHAWSVIEPRFYGAWIEHLVKRGNVVFFPRNQVSILTPSTEFLPNTIEAFHDALTRLDGQQHTSIDTDRVAYVGHSAGATMIMNLAVVADEHNLPVPVAVMAINAAARRDDQPMGEDLMDLSQIPSSTLLLTIACEDDMLVDTHDAIRIYYETTAIPAANKNYVLIRSDGYGHTPLIADHVAALAYGDTVAPTSLEFLFMPSVCVVFGRVCSSSTANDALDYYGFWKLFDALTDAAFYNTNREYALGNTAEQRYMGLFSDGTPVRELTVSDTP